MKIKEKITNNIMDGFIKMLPAIALFYVIDTASDILQKIEKITHLESIYRLIPVPYRSFLSKIITILLGILVCIVVNFVGSKLIRNRLDWIKKRIPAYNTIETIGTSIFKGIGKDSIKRSVWVWYQNLWHFGVVTYEDEKKLIVYLQMGFAAAGGVLVVPPTLIQPSNVSPNKVLSSRGTAGIAETTQEIMDEYDTIKKDPPI